MSNASPMMKFGAASADNATVIEITDNAELFDTWQLSSSAGVMDVYVSADGTNYLSAPVALINLGSVDPATAVIETAAGGSYGFKGRWQRVLVLQKGATAVVGGALYGYQS